MWGDLSAWFVFLFRLLVKAMKKQTMKTIGAPRKRMMRTHSSTWMSLCFRRALATCYPRCASWPYSTRSSRSSVWSGITASRRVRSRYCITSKKTKVSLQMCMLKLQLHILLSGSSGGVQEGEGDRQEAGVWRPLHHWAAVWWWHQGPVGSTRHQHPVSRSQH